MRIILDPGVTFHREALVRLAELPHPILMPVVAFAERVRHLQRDGFDVEAFRRTLRRARVQVEAMTEEHALRYAGRLVDDEAGRKTSRDAFIAGHVGTDDVLWTTHAADFVKLGLRRDQIVEIG